MKRLRPLWIVLGIGALVRGSADMSVLVRERIELAAVVRRTEELKKDFDSRDYRRPVLRGTPRSGNAWDHYLLAVRELDSEDKFSNAYVHLLSDYAYSRSTADPSAVDQVLAKHRSVLDHIRKGVLCGEARYPYHWSVDHIRPGVRFGDPDFEIDWSKEWRSSNPRRQNQAIHLLSLAMSKRLRADGREMEATELMLDLCLFSRDCDQSNLGPGSGGSVSMLDELHDILLSGKLSTPELMRLDRELGVLIDASADPTHAHLNKVLERGMDIRREARYGRQMCFYQSEGVDFTAGWRDFHSYPLLNSRAFRLLDRWTAQLAAAEKLPWNEARNIENAVYEEAQGAGKVMEMVSEVSFGGAGNRRQEAAMLGILRVAAHYLTTGEKLQIPDPLGFGPLKVEVGAKVRIWSVGRDGVDESGRGSWRGYYNEDLVLELNR